MKKIIQNTLIILSKKEQKSLALLSVLNICVSILDIAALAGVLAVINVYAGSKYKSVLPVWLDRGNVLVAAGVFLLLFIAKNFIAFAVFKKQLSFVYKVAARISADQLPEYFKGGFNEFVRTGNAVISRRVQYQPVEFAQYVLSSLQQILTEAVLVSITIVAILLFDARLFLLLLIFLLPPVFFVAGLSKKKLKSVRRNVKNDAEKTTQYLQEALDSYVEANIYDKSTFFSNRYSALQKKLNNHLSELQAVQGMPSRLIEVFAVFGLLVLIILQQLTGEQSDIISLGAFVAAAYKIIPGIVRIANLGTLIKTYSYTVQDLAGTSITVQTSKTSSEKIETISLKNIAFQQQNKTIINDLSINIHSGDFIALTGISGKGKSTLLNILLGFLEHDSGTVTINGTERNAEERRRLQASVSYVKQQSFLINDTIARNITLSEELQDEQLLEKVIEMAGLSDFIKSLPEGKEHCIKDNGKNISGGQRQRIAIARALYKNAPVIIMDEPFNELDEESERKLLLHFKQLASEGKIVILVSHSNLVTSYCNKTVSLDA